MTAPKRPLNYYLDALGDQLCGCRGYPDADVGGVANDSRQVGQNFVFVAIRGWQFDGTQFISDAVAAGAVSVVLEESAEVNIPPEINIIWVRNAYIALGLLAEAEYGYPTRNLELIGITGTNGKTTCATLLRNILADAGFKTGLISTVHYEIGDEVQPADRTTPMPLELQQLFSRMVETGVEYVIMEVSSHALDQRRLGSAEFRAGLFTNLTEDHCDYHLNMDNYFNAKQILFNECMTNNSIVVVNGDDDYGTKLIENLNNSNAEYEIYSFGYTNDVDFRIEDCQLSVQGLKLQFSDNGEQLPPMESPLIGDFNVENIAGVVCLARKLKVEHSSIVRAVADFKGTEGRLQKLENGTGVHVVVDYAHTNDALENVLKTLRSLQPQRLYVVFGCGGDRDKGKRPLMGATAATLADQVFVTSDNPRSESPAAILDDIMNGIDDTSEVFCIEDRREAINTAIKQAEPGSIVLIAGKGHEKFQERNGKKIAFDDVQEAQKALGLR